MVGASSKRELDNGDAMLPLSDSPDAWKTAKPLTEIYETQCPFDKDGLRPTEKEVR